MVEIKVTGYATLFISQVREILFDPIVQIYPNSRHWSNRTIEPMLSDGLSPATIGNSDTPQVN
jgi:hypothetical protein